MTNIGTAVKLTNRVVRTSREFNKNGMRISRALHVNAGETSFAKDIVYIEQDFGKTQIEIVSKYNHYNELVEREKTIQREGKDDIITKSLYNKEETKNLFNEYVDFFQVSRQNYVADKIVSEQNKMLTYVYKQKDYDVVLSDLTRKMKDDGISEEVQTIKSYNPSKPNENSKKYIKTVSERAKDGNTLLKEVDTNIEKLKNISDKKDPYIAIRMYSNKDFINSALTKFLSRFGAGADDINVKMYPSMISRGSYEHSNKTFMFEPFFPKSWLVNTIAHESRHRKQCLYIDALKNTVNKNEKKLGKSFNFAYNTYKFHLNGLIYPLYSMNLLERDARKVGKRMQKEYERKTMNLYKEFPMASPMQFGMDYSETLTPKNIFGFKKRHDQDEIHWHYMSIT